MLKRILFSAFLISSTLLIGCRSVPMASEAQDTDAKKFQTKSNAANIYIYRNETLGGSIKIDLFLNGKMVGRTLADTYVKLEVPAGTHHLLSESENKSELDVKVENGKNYFIWQEAKLGIWLARNKLQNVDEATGKKGVNECKLIQIVSE